MFHLDVDGLIEDMGIAAYALLDVRSTLWYGLANGVRKAGNEALSVIP